MARFFSIKIVSVACMALIAGLLLAILNLSAQTSSAEEEKSWFLSFIENQLSTPNRQIRIHNIEGTLSAQASIDEITIADTQGIWLRITQAKIDWNRSALFMGTLDINSLTAAQIEILRRPLSDTTSWPRFEASSFTLPELPISLKIGQISSPALSLGATIIGRQTRLALNGTMAIDAEHLNARFNILDLETKGYFNLLADYTRETNILKIDLDLNEPENSVVANLLQLENLPNVKMTLAGEGQLENMDINLALLADNILVLDGQLKLQANANGLNFYLTTQESLAALLPQPYRLLLGASSQLNIVGLLPNQGGWQINDFSLTSGESVHVQAQAIISADHFLQKLLVNARLASVEQTKIPLPFNDGIAQLDSLLFNLAYGEEGKEEWSGQLELKALSGIDARPLDVTLSMGGQATHLDDAARRYLSVFIYGGAVESNQPKKNDLQPDKIGLLVDMDLRGNSGLNINSLDITSQAFSLNLQGIIKDWLFDGLIKLTAHDLNALPFALNQQQLEQNSLKENHLGRAHIEAKGQIALISGAFDLALQGGIYKDVRGYVPRNYSNLSPLSRSMMLLLENELSLSGQIRRDEAGINFNTFELKNQTLQIGLDGEIGAPDTNLDFSLTLSNLNLLDKRLQGGWQILAAARGHNQFITFSARSEFEKVTLNDHILSQTALNFNGFIDNTPFAQNQISGKLEGEGQFGQQPLRLQADFNLDQHGQRLDNLLFTLGEIKLSGALAHNPPPSLTQTANFDGLTGNLQFEVPDLSSLAALLLIETQGQLHGAVEFQAQDGVEGWLKASDIKFDRYELNNLEITSRLIDGVSHINALAKHADYGTLTAQAVFDSSPPHGSNLTLEQLHFVDGELAVILSTPASISLKSNAVSILNDMRLQIGTAHLAAQDPSIDEPSGLITLSGEIADSYALDMQLDKLPLELINLLQPHLKTSPLTQDSLAGTLDGLLQIRGERVASQIYFTLQAEKISSDFLKKYRLPPLTITAQGTLDQSQLSGVATLRHNLKNEADIEISAKGKIEFETQGLDVDITLEKFSLIPLAQAFAAQNLNGHLAGSAHLHGTLSKPQATLSLQARQISSLLLIENGLSPLEASLEGNFAEGQFAISNLVARGPQALQLTVQGSLPVSGSGFNLQTQGMVPLALANRYLVARGSQLAGQLDLNAHITGSLYNPLLSGNVTVQNGRFIDPLTNVRLNDITINAQLAGSKIILNNMQAVSANGGQVRGSGTISTNIEQGLPAQITLTLDHSRYNDTAMIAATLDGTITLTGPLLHDFEIGGAITVERAEISVPHLKSTANEIDVQHKNPSKAIRTTLARTQIETIIRNDNASRHLPVLQKISRPRVPRFNLNIHAPARIFVRGRGLDSELGGTIHLSGTLANPQPTGNFSLLRGRFDVLTKRLELDEGRISLAGNLDPDLYFVAHTQGNGVDVNITVSGTPTNLSIAFASQPVLPQDEILARVIFNRSLGELSPLQIAQLAASAAQLAGSGDASLLSRLRQATGLDDIDLITGNEGSPGVKVGRYVRDNIYLGLEAASDGTTKGSINLDITQGLKAKGSVDSNSNSTVGIFYEKDY